MRYPQDQNLAPKCCELCSRNKTPTQTALGGSIDTERTHLSIVWRLNKTLKTDQLGKAELCCNRFIL